MTSTPENPETPVAADRPVVEGAAVPAEEATAPAEEAAPAAEETTSAVDVPDERLLAAHDIARVALHEVTSPATVGDPAGYTVEADGVVSLRFANLMLGYPGWFWTVSVAVVEGAEPTVLEVELLPGDEALLAPEWVPWAVRLAEYQAQQLAAAEAADEASDHDVDDEGDDDELDQDDLDDQDLDDEDDLDDVDDLDAADFDEDGSPILHAGDVDGVDIDELDESADDELDDDGDDEFDESDDDADDELDDSEEPTDDARESDED